MPFSPSPEAAAAAAIRHENVNLFPYVVDIRGNDSISWQQSIDGIMLFIFSGQYTVFIVINDENVGSGDISTELIILETKRHYDHQRKLFPDCLNGYSGTNL